MCLVGNILTNFGSAQRDFSLYMLSLAFLLLHPDALLVFGIMEFNNSVR